MNTVTNSLLTLVVASGFSNAATLLQTVDPATYTDAAFGEGNWHYQSLTLNDTGFSSSGDALGATATLDSITFVHDDSSTNDNLYMVVLSDATDLGTIVAQSTNTVDMSGLASGDLFTWNFSGETLTTTTEYFFAVYQDTSGNGTIEAGDTATTARFGMAGSIAGSTRSAPSGGIGDSRDLAFTLTLNTTAVPEPSSTALLGLGGLALILRRRK